MGVTIPVSNILVIQQNASEMQIANKKVVVLSAIWINQLINSSDSNETFTFRGKDKVEWTDKSAGGEIIQRTNAELARNKLTVTVRNFDKIKGNSVIKREFTLLKDGKTMTLTIKTQDKYSCHQIQHLTYNRE
jgi:hypothetical protein